jgi:hypothetical protein
VLYYRPILFFGGTIPELPVSRLAYGAALDNIGKAVTRHFTGGKEARKHISTHLVYADSNGWGRNITQIQDFDLGETLPKLRNWVGKEKFGLYENANPNFALATSLQLHPRYHGTYQKLVRQDDGKVLARPDPEEIHARSVDAYWDSDQTGRCNDSLVNPLAAALIQRNIVAAALERSMLE